MSRLLGFAAPTEGFFIGVFFAQFRRLTFPITKDSMARVMIVGCDLAITKLVLRTHAREDLGRIRKII